MATQDSTSLTPLGKIKILIEEFKENNQSNPMLEHYLKAFEENWDDYEDIVNHLQITHNLLRLLEQVLPICNR